MDSTTILPSLTIGNFKAFRGINHIELAPLTILYGPNSSGKSSILQAILMLADTLALNGNTRDLGHDNRLRLACNQRTDLGSHANFTHGQGALRRSISLGFQARKSIIHPSCIRECSLPSILDEISGYQIVLHFSEPGPTDSPIANRIDVLYGKEKTRLLSYLLDSASDAFVPNEECITDYISWLEDLRLLADNWETPFCLWELTSSFGGHALLPWLANTRSDRLLILEPAAWAEEGEENPDPCRHSLSNQMIWLFKEMDLRSDELARILFAFDIDTQVITWRTQRLIRVDSPTTQGGTQKPLELRVSESMKNALQGAIELKSTCSRCTPDKLGMSEASVEFLRKLVVKGIFGLDDYSLEDSLYKIASLLCCFPVPLRFAGTIGHIGPLRPQPKRFYSTTSVYSNFPTSPPPEWLKKILQSSEAGIASCNNWLRRLDIDYSMKVIQSSDSVIGNYITVSLTDLATDTRHTLCDVGFGLSQIIPIITTAALSEGQLLMVEQPELHLHPRLQAELGNLFVESCTKVKPNQWIIESHSELLLLRVRRLIRDGAISSSSVKVIYVDPTRKGSRLKILRIGEDGEMLDDWPAGFFEDKLIEMEGLL
ncbi:AAA family ATPase [Synechococcus sp. L2F]|uniref:AAA family ATPase n=1 Tax=Synechococcus sp. L2F TaxID=2823739 RepID=UPI0020CDFF9E|nr:AAA family ATPase [Synechococcus sp. L2F]MCP9829307.1 AAA family ATPase [Synechococcus sp. L2F]